MKISGRNQLTGKVQKVTTGAVMAEVTIDVNGQTVVSAITNNSVKELSLKAGDDVTALIKSTDVMILK